METARNYVSIIITIISNITVLVLHNVICFGYFIAMSYGVNKKAPPIISSHPFWPGLFFCFTGHALWTVFALIRLLQKIMHFESKTNFFFQLIAGQFWFCCFVYMCFLGRLSQFCYQETTKSFTFAHIHSFLFGFSSNHVA